MTDNFENSLSELEKVIAKLQNSEVSLEESIALFEKGVKLSENCRKILTDAETKILNLSDAEGEKID